ncbi:DUF2235 domain-containing protein [Jannaschia aquimarina]|uniref:T6SS Phospholipase effector Tle1-like catalytic domain-containing protein n=1 Tax=Jannaschia aquimarina TaxID=935700 RepID=A0A0D1EJL2_9RHOB|nr:DUF2235 domain-containing protein [Jannaschia aquimarina]KIT17769.1 hypothetical protein jaqu_04930 [Jannaschia aquimarina]SNS95833.1 Uncharacterized alpha/beta hydrolase domain [Jannaschia aquimarina]
MVISTLKTWFARGRPQDVERDVAVHVVLLDGTMSSLEPGRESSVGLTFRLLEEAGGACLHYEPGLQWHGLRRAPEIMAGVGINRQIQRAYAFLARHWHPGDRIYLIGYSRGAYAVRALAGMIDRIGLLRAEVADDDTIAEAYAHYRDDPTTPASRSFAARLCHSRVTIDAIGVFDTVRAVGIRWPLLWRLFPHVHAFRSARLGQVVERGYHALALNETRMAFRPELWRTHGHRTESVEQVWFRGAHPDVGGQLSGVDAARPLANVPLVWMLGRLEGAGLPLPPDWRKRFEVDATAPMVGSWRSFGPLFLYRRRREVGRDASERVHPSAQPPDAPSEGAARIAS